MKLLAFVDVHGSLKAIREITEKAKKNKPDLLVCAGDISIFSRGLDSLLQIFSKMEIPMLIVHGNHETEEELGKSASFFRNVSFIHNTILKRDDCIFFGYGGGGFSMVDSELKRTIKKVEQLVKQPNKKLILVTHAPPYNTRVDRIMGRPCGNKTVREFVEKAKPSLLITGHLHENAGKEDKIGKTRIVNPGPYGKVIDI